MTLPRLMVGICLLLLGIPAVGAIRFT